MKHHGFTLIEMMVIIAVLLIFLLLAAPVLFSERKDTTNPSNISFGFNGTIESRCVEGYKFLVDNKSGARQILDEFGKGVRCN